MQHQIENRLWTAAHELRVAMPEAEYASNMFPLMFWKYLSDTWDHRHRELLADKTIPTICRSKRPAIEHHDCQSLEISLIATGTVTGQRASWSSVLATVTQLELG